MLLMTKNGICDKLSQKNKMGRIQLWKKNQEDPLVDPLDLC